VPDPLANSYYRASANTFEPQPALEAALRADVCVIGGGFTGLSAALAAAEAGMSVILLEAETIGFGASGRNGGQLIPGLRWSLRDLAAKFGVDRAEAIFALALTARDAVHARIARHAIACDLKPGHLEAAHKPAHFEEMCREVELRRSEMGDETLEIIAPADMTEHVGTDQYHGGVLDRSGGHFHPLNYALGLAQACLAAGVQIFERSGVTAFQPDGPIEARTAGGSVSAARAIIACDSWTGDLIPTLGSYTVPIMNYNIATAPLSPALAHAILPSRLAVADSRFVLNYYRLSADNRLIFGGGEKYSQTPPAEIGAFVRPHMVRLFPALEATPIEFAWGGAVPVTANRLPHLGRLGNCYFAHGFSGHGALLTTLAGELLAEALTGRFSRYALFDALPHQRFPGGKFLQRPLAALGLIYYAMRDRL
jgi:gamma-glutamylputrescine oxidase